jgi:seryl-tRNA synthetase
MDIHYIRENPDVVKQNQINRFKDPEIVDDILELDSAWKSLRYRSDKLRNLKNRLNMCFKNAPKEETLSWDDDKYTLNQIIDDLIEKRHDENLLTRNQLKTVSKYVGELNDLAEGEADKKLVERDSFISELGNRLYKESPIDNNEDNNPVVFEVKNQPNQDFPEEPNDHIDLLDKLGFVDIDNGIRIAGNRGYFFTGLGVKLNQAIINYGLDFLENKDYQLMDTPHIVKKEIMGKIAQLSEYDETLYKLDGYNQYLIATSEQPLTAYFEKRIIKDEDLPIKLCGLSHCYRKETGAHTRHTRGIYRVHQFQKLEQFYVTKPEESWDRFYEMIEISKEFYQTLGLSFRVVNIVSGALNNAAAMKYDLEAWYPGSKAYCELVSCTNVLDYFSKRISTKDQRKNYLHMLNCTLMANTRTMCALVETYQTKDGFVVPEILRKYMGNREFIPFNK